ncbi:DUF2236 domain-containing protein [Amycolatopsis sp. RM579]|uniref:DUF2236 domain-containing protein n=2 Tax=Amycolatopsis pithecellobii TaxID=664692 RepID=A0A6N7YRG7_9PSEU|nr:DUF2236 domain-containing protein [Amycolatopsis pithecellobii]
MVWEVLLHPATVVFETVAQGTLQLHAPLWFGDTPTATRMAGHLRNIHRRVKGDVIDVGMPELGGYAATEPRDAMWAALTELHPVLWMYESFAYHGDGGPRQLTEEQRDQYVRELGVYLRLTGASAEDIPGSMAELDALYDKYWDFFGHSDTMNIVPETGEDNQELMVKAMQRNWHPSQQLAADMLHEVYEQFRTPILASFPERIQIKAGLSQVQRTEAVKALDDAQPLIRELQQPESERRIMRMMWGPDAIMLIESARELHRRALPWLPTS